MSRITFIVGGARSGKSRYAEGLAAKHRVAKTYIATAETFDGEMRERIAAHREQRGNSWETIEAPLELCRELRDSRAEFILVDCITVWMGNLLHHGRDVKLEITELCQVLRQSNARVVVVSNEVGSGIVPDNALARVFRDAQGLANQCIAEVADEVILVVAGLPMTLKKSRRKAGSTQAARSSRDRRV